MKGYYQFSLRLFVVLTTLAALLIVWTHSLYGRIERYNGGTDLHTLFLSSEAIVNVFVWATVVLGAFAWVSSGPRTES